MMRAAVRRAPPAEISQRTAHRRTLATQLDPGRAAYRAALASPQFYAAIQHVGSPESSECRLLSIRHGSKKRCSLNRAGKTGEARAPFWNAIRRKKKRRITLRRRRDVRRVQARVTISAGVLANEQGPHVYECPVCAASRGGSIVLGCLRRVGGSHAQSHSPSGGHVCDCCLRWSLAGRFSRWNRGHSPQ
jgi:hypothetical protein